MKLDAGVAAAVSVVAAMCAAAAPLRAEPPRPGEGGPLRDGVAPASSRPAPAARRPVIVLPAALVDDDGVRRPPRPTERVATAIAGELDAVLTDAAQDLGLSVDLTARALGDPASRDERGLTERARASGELVLSPGFALGGEGVEIRLTLALPSTRALWVRVERVPREDVAVRAAVMLRDLAADLEGARGRAGRPDAGAPGVELPGARLATPARSVGRATLAVNATVYGGLVGYSLQRSSGSEDPRLLYPLLAVGAGIGLGGSIIIAEEWDVGLGDAWFLSAGAWWPTLAAHFIYEGRFAPHAADADQERWAFGLVGGTTGVALATLGLTLGGMSDGGALTAHSGGGLGMVLGGLTEVAVAGDVDKTPFAGMGYGAALGWLAAAAVATQVRVAPSRVLSIDLGALLGGLGGAALGSPLLFDEPNRDQQRAWIGATAGGLLAGAGIAWFVTRPAAADAALLDRAESPSWISSALPTIGVVGESAAGGRRAPVLGLSIQGRMR